MGLFRGFIGFRDLGCLFRKVSEIHLQGKGLWCGSRYL